jgi:hypothetical protein
MQFSSLAPLRAFDAGRGRGEKQQDENTADDLKRQHWSILLLFCLLIAIPEKQTPERRVRSMPPLPLSLNGA